MCHHLLYSLLYVALFAGCSAARGTGLSTAMTTIYIVRHAEKLSSDRDTPLSPVGEARALALADRLAMAEVQRVYATDLQRTQQTVGPLAERMGLAVHVLPAMALDSLVQRVRSVDQGMVVLVAGHNHTVPELVQRLSGVAVDGIPEHVFDRLYRVVLPADGKPEVVVLQYGEPTP